MLNFLPSLPLQLGCLTQIGLTLALGIVMGDCVVRFLHLPRVSGYVLAGLLVGPGALNWVDKRTWSLSSPMVDLALGVILFECGGRLDVRWIVHNRMIGVTSALESVTTFAAVYVCLVALKIEAFPAAMAAAIGMATSATGLLPVIHEQRASGTMTEYALTMTALNNMLAICALMVLLGFALQDRAQDLSIIILHPLYLLAGSCILAAGIVYGFALMARKLRPVMRVPLLLAMLLGCIGLAQVLNLSVIITLLSLGVLWRQFGRVEQFGKSWDLLSQTLTVILLVLVGASLQPQALATGAAYGAVFCLARGLAKFLAVTMSGPLSGLRFGKSVALGVALSPMSAIAVAMRESIANIYPALGQTLSAIVLWAVLYMELLGPLAVPTAIWMAREERAA